MKKLAFLFIFPILGFLSCNKEPGPGGTSSISGKVYVYDLNAIGLDTLSEYYAMDEDVYIIYGDETETYSDKFSTSFDGSYRFDYLTPGTYTIFAYTRCDACPNETDVVKKVVEVSAKKTEYPQSDIVILK